MIISLATMRLSCGGGQPDNIRGTSSHVQGGGLGVVRDGYLESGSSPTLLFFASSFLFFSVQLAPLSSRLCNLFIEFSFVKFLIMVIESLPAQLFFVPHLKPSKSSPTLLLIFFLKS